MCVRALRIYAHLFKLIAALSAAFANTDKGTLSPPTTTLQYAKGGPQIMIISFLSAIQGHSRTNPTLNTKVQAVNGQASIVAIHVGRKLDMKISCPVQGPIACYLLPSPCRFL